MQSDETPIRDGTWSTVKEHAMKPNLEKASWFVSTVRWLFNPALFVIRMPGRRTSRELCGDLSRLKRGKATWIGYGPCHIRWRTM